MLGTGEGLDHEHWGAAMPAHEGRPDAALIGAALAVFGGRRGQWLMQRLANARDVVLAVGVCEQTVVADAMEARGQHVQQEAAHELFGRYGHGFVAGASVLSIVLPTERDAAVVPCHEARVCDRHPMGVSGQICEHRLGSSERSLGVDHPLALSQRHQPIGEGLRVGQIQPRLKVKSCAIQPIVDAQARCAYTMRMLFWPLNGASNVHRAPQ